MNFFEHQDQARRNTARLVALFVAAVVGIILLVYVLAVLLLPLAAGVAVDGEGTGEVGFLPREMTSIRWLDLTTLGIVSVGVIGVVGLSSLYKISRLSGGGTIVATQLGGRLISPETGDPHERRVLNVVEEMAIASGVSVPPVYLMDQEAGINAFAAGYTPRDAVIGVTRGTIETLNRDELQGVMAHEFSHILNGDMRLNIRLIGILHGILVIGMIGYFLLRSVMFAPRRRSSRDGGGGGAVIAIAAFGVGLAVIGFVGTFFGNLIKASVSRQREFLADASAVQFTRNPEGIAGALKKIGGIHFGSRMKSAMASEASHMFFAAGLSNAFGSLTATHPPLSTRIKRIDPGWNGVFPEVDPPGGAKGRSGRFSHAASGFAGVGAASAAAPESPSSAIDDIGTLSDRSIHYASELLERIPASVTSAARDAFSARAVVLALLLDSDEAIRATQMEMIRARDEGDGMGRVVEGLVTDVATLDPALRLPLLDICIGSLRTMTRGQYEVFRTRVQSLIRADDQIDLFEWVLLRILRRHLDAQFVEGSARPRVAYYGLQRLAGECRVLLSTLAYAGHRDRETATRAFGAGASRLGIPIGAMAEPGECGLRALEGALDKLEQVSMKLKRDLLTACATCIAWDRTVTVREGELLRAISDDLDCPMPPLLPAQPLV